MIELLLAVIILELLLSLALAFLMFRKNPEPQEKIVTKITPFVTPTHPDLINPSVVSQNDSVIVEPKSPQLVAWEEEEAVRKLNLKPR
jgi:hypothetical protein